MPLLLVVDEGQEVEDVLRDAAELDDVGLDVVLVLVVDVAVVPEELDVELVVEVPEVDVLRLEVELALVADDVVLEDAVEGGCLMCNLKRLRKRRSKWTWLVVLVDVEHGRVEGEGVLEGG